MPFIAVGPGVKTNYTGTVSYNHSSVLKSVEAILQLPVLSKVSGANALSDLFKAGQYPERPRAARPSRDLNFPA